MLRFIGRAPRMFCGLGAGAYALAFLLGSVSLTLTGCGDTVKEGDKIEQVDFAKKGADSMQNYMQQKSAKKAEAKK